MYIPKCRIIGAAAHKYIVGCDEKSYFVYYTWYDALISTRVVRVYPEIYVPFALEFLVVAGCSGFVFMGWG